MQMDGINTAGRALQVQLVDIGVQRRLDGIVADLTDPAFHHVETVEWYARNLPSLVIHPEDYSAAFRVGEGRQLIRKLDSIRDLNSASCHHDALELQGRVLAEPDAPCQVFGSIHVRSLPFNISSVWFRRTTTRQAFVGIVPQDNGWRRVDRLMDIRAPRSFFATALLSNERPQGTRSSGRGPRLRARGRSREGRVHNVP